jgi:hypothetical protein
VGLAKSESRQVSDTHAAKLGQAKVTPGHFGQAMMEFAGMASMLDDAKRYTYYKSDDGFEVWGKHHRNLAGEVTWRLRVFSDQDRRIETYNDAIGKSPKGRRTGDSQAMANAIASWSR